MKKRVVKNMSNKLFYTLIVIGVLILGCIGVFALTSAPTPGTTPNPGHSLSTIAPPEGCNTGQYLKYYVDMGGNYQWICDTPSSGGGEGGISDVKVITSVESDNYCVAYCPSGKVPISGGCKCHEAAGYDEAFISESYSKTYGDPGWVCKCLNAKGEYIAAGCTAVAYCVDSSFFS